MSLQNNAQPAYSQAEGSLIVSGMSRDHDGMPVSVNFTIADTDGDTVLLRGLGVHQGQVQRIRRNAIQQRVRTLC